MKPENRKFLDENRHHYDTYVKAQYIKQFDGATKNTLLRIIHEEFNPGYPDPVYCQVCVAEMLVHCYTQYDKWIIEDRLMNGDGKSVHVPGIIDAIKSELDGATLKTTFPLHDKPRVSEFGKIKGDTKKPIGRRPVGGPPPKPAKRRKRK